MAKYVTNPHEKHYFATQIFIMSCRNAMRDVFIQTIIYNNSATLPIIINDHGLFGLNGWADAEGCPSHRLWQWEGSMTLTLKASFQDDSLATLPALRPVAVLSLRVRGNLSALSALSAGLK